MRRDDNSKSKTPPLQTPQGWGTLRVVLICECAKAFSFDGLVLEGLGFVVGPPGRKKDGDVKSPLQRHG